MLRCTGAPSLTGCATWQTTTQGREVFGPEPLEYAVRVTSTDGTQFILWDAVLRNDSIVGTSRSRVCARNPNTGANQCRQSQEAAGLLMGDLARVEQHKTSAGATAAVIVGVPLVFLAIGLARWER